MARNFLNGGSRTKQIRDKAGFYRVGGGHLISIGANEFKKHPEYFSLINGKRAPEGNAGCWSNPGFREYVLEKLSRFIKKNELDILNAFPADIVPRCQCEQCSKDSDISSRWFNFYASLIEKLKRRFPKLEFGGIAYQEYRRVPRDKVRFLEYVQYCQYNRCYVHKIGDPKCGINKKSIEELNSWRKKASMGIYGYEFDVFKPVMFVPFWNMLANEATTYRDMGIVFMKTEMSMRYSKGTPREDQMQQKLRLSYYIYSRLIWNPDERPDAIIADWCSTVYGPAAPPMEKYFASMAAAWDAMPIHLSYFGTKPIGTSGHFISPTLIKTAKACFSKARKAISGVSDAGKRNRMLADLKVDKALFKQWEDLYHLSLKNSVKICLPLLKNNDDWSKSVKLAFKYKDPEKNLKPTEGYAYWSSDALHLKIVCYDDKMVELRKGKKGRDAIWSCPSDKIEVFIDLNDGDSYKHFACNPAGGVYEAKGMDATWNPDWKLKTKVFKDRWETEFTLPFSSLGAKVKTGDIWNVVLDRNYAGNSAGFPMPAYHDLSIGAVFYFSDKATPDRNINWIAPPKFNIGRILKFFPKLLKNGWNFRLHSVNSPIELASNGNGVIIFDAVASRIRLPEKLQKRLRIAVRNGSIVLFHSKYTLKLEDYFDDPTFKIAFSERLDPIRKSVAFDDHFSSSISKTDLRKYWLRPTPPGEYTPDIPEKWIIAATHKMKDGTVCPYLLFRAYGKGMVVVAVGPLDYGKGPGKFLSLINSLRSISEKIHIGPQTTAKTTNSKM